MSANLAIVEAPSPRPPLFVERADGLWEFHGTTPEEHLVCWQEIAAEAERDLWQMGAIAASLVTKYDEDTIGTFAHKVRLSPRRVREIAQTYRAFENGGASPILSFKHHSVAARAKKKGLDPVEVVHKAEDLEWNPEELGYYVKTGLEPQPKPAKAGKGRVARELQSLSRKALADHIEFDAIPTLIALQNRCSDPSFASKFYGNYIGDLQEHRQVLLDEETQHAVLTAWEMGYKTEDQLSQFTKTDLSEVRRVMLQLEEDGYFVEQPLEWKPDQAKGGRSKIWRRTSKPLPSELTASVN